METTAGEASEVQEGHDNMAMWKSEKLPKDIMEQCYQSRDYPEDYIKLLRQTSGAKAECLYVSDNEDHFKIEIKEIRIDNWEQSDKNFSSDNGYITVRDVKGDIAHVYDHISDKKFQKATDNIMTYIQRM